MIYFFITGTGVMANMLALGASDSRFESAVPDERYKARV